LKNNQTPIIFTHIPKTAGTSFRVALEGHYGFNSVCRDYGPQAPETTSFVYKYIYDEKDFFSFLHRFKKNKSKSLAGHFPVVKYARLFPSTDIVTFIRNPYERVISEYKHFVRHSGFDGTLMEFAEQGRNVNTQSRLLDHVPLNSLGFIGLTERYSESVNLYNAIYDRSIPIFNSNISPAEQIIEGGISQSDKDRIISLNENDFILYSHVLNIFEMRSKLHSQKQVYTFGQFHLAENNHIMGWAFQMQLDAPVEIEIYIDDMLVGELLANEYNITLDSLKSPRNGYVGFRFKLPSKTLSSQVSCKVKETDQLLPFIN